ncbi:ATP-binding cassette domain-containing protein [Lactococcus lactis]|uniref:ATP-binding cassette domain-containing protein n=1 Tax=Lactococcus lactis TaxID=1358 RepID=UPI0024A9A53F|nr:ATP-binding cassette domain-containing protein [Lactococcus lactis]
MIELQNISKSFEDNIVIDQFSYTFQKGQSYAIIGMSGSGKTTLLNIIGKLEKPTNGEVIVDGVSLKKIKEKDYFKNCVGYLFQNYGLIENESIENNLNLSIVDHTLNKNQRAEKMKSALLKVNLNLDLKRKVFSLSGGEAQRVAIAKLILKDPPIILADEPTASLDEHNSSEIIKLLFELMTEERIIIVSTHSPTVYNKVAHIIQLEKL